MGSGWLWGEREYIYLMNNFGRGPRALRGASGGWPASWVLLPLGFGHFSPRSSPGSPTEAPGAPQAHHQRAQEHPRTAHRGPRSSPGQPTEAPGGAQGSPEAPGGAQDCPQRPQEQLRTAHRGQRGSPGPSSGGPFASLPSISRQCGEKNALTKEAGCQHIARTPIDSTT